jgi:hypothetical protein
MLTPPDHPGPRPPGNPTAMRALADELRAHARRTGHLGDVRTPTWQGVGARAFAARLRGTTARAVDNATRGARARDPHWCRTPRGSCSRCRTTSTPSTDTCGARPRRHASPTATWAPYSPWTWLRSCGSPRAKTTGSKILRSSFATQGRSATATVTSTTGTTAAATAGRKPLPVGPTDAAASSFSPLALTRRRASGSWSSALRPAHHRPSPFPARHLTADLLAASGSAGSSAASGEEPLPNLLPRDSSRPATRRELTISVTSNQEEARASGRQHPGMQPDELQQRRPRMSPEQAILLNTSTVGASDAKSGAPETFEGVS